MSDAVNIYQAIGLAPNDTVEFFRAKVAYPVSRRWWEVWQEEHTRAFTVAGINDRLVLQQVRASLHDVIANGGTFEMWKKDVLPGLIQARDNGTAPPNIISDARLRIIYSTNLRMARAAGQWKRIQQLKEVAPYLMYSAIMDDRTRPLHRKWHRTVLPVDHPWWNTHFPPCGWNCRCTTVQLTEDELQRRGLKVSDMPPNDGPDRDWVRGDGVIESVPPGIDPGFAYNVGKAHMRGLVPTPIDGPVYEPKIVTGDNPPWPDPRVEPADKLLPKNLAVEDATVEWNRIVGLTKDHVVITDPTGEKLIIDDSFWVAGDGRSKITKRGRQQFLWFIAETLKNPDEIWSTWEVDDPAQRLPDTPAKAGGIVRRFIARFQVEGETRNLVIFLELSRDGWSGMTAFNTSEKYLQARRHGVLEYRRK